MTDEKLIELLEKNPKKGFEKITDTYSALVFRVIYNIIKGCGSKEDAEECAADVFVSFYRNRNSFDISKCSLGGFLAVCARRRAVSFLRQKKAVRIIPLEEADGESESCAYEIEEKEEKSIIYNAVSSLGEPDKTIILRKYYLGETAKEIASRLSMNPETVQKRAQRALGKLKAILLEGGVIYE